VDTLAGLLFFSEITLPRSGRAGLTGQLLLALRLRLIHPTMGRREPSPMAELTPIFDTVIAGAGLSDVD
jgi:hypothetical protein